MIALSDSRLSLVERNTCFIQMLPAIVKYTGRVLRHLPPEAKQDALSEVVARCFVAYHRLVELGRESVVYPTVLASFAIRQFRSGRRVGGNLSINDVLSPRAQQAKGIGIGTLDHRDETDGSWREVLVEDKTAGPAEIAANRIDFGDWLRSLPPRHREIAESLSTGETTTDAARKFAISAGRVSQMRSQLKKSWEEFAGQDG